MEIAKTVSSRATCPRKHVGAVLVRNRTILSTGYNGSIHGLPHCTEVGCMMEDSHCVVGATVISKFQTGYYNTGHRSVEYIYNNWYARQHKRGALRRMKIRAMAPTGLLVPTHITDIWQTGVKDTYRITTSLGRSTVTTRDQRFYTPNGWRRLDKLKIGTKVALNGQSVYTDTWIAKKYLAGTTMQKLAALVGVSRGTIKRRLLKQNVKLRAYKLGGWNKGMRRGGSATYKGRNVSDTVGRSRARRYALADTCYICGSVSPRLEVHHLDKDALNDSDSNLLTLCTACHSLAHTPHAKVEQVRFDRVVKIEAVGQQMTYDLEVADHHNFVGDGFILQNCVRTSHAEINAIIQAAKNGVMIDGAECYITASPCWNCFKALANAGVKRIVYGEFYRDDRIFEVAETLGIEMVGPKE